MNTSSLGDICSFVSGGTPTKTRLDFWDGSIPWISGADISERGHVTPRNHISAPGLDGSAANKVLAGTLLLVTRTSIGKAAVAPFELTFSQDITALFHDAQVVDRDYLRAFLSLYAPALKAASRGATIQGVNRKDIEEIQVPLPSLEEQRRIAGILDEADELRAKRRKSLELLDELRDSVTSAFLEQQVSDSVLLTINDIASHVTKGTTPTSIGYAYTDAGVPFLRVQDLIENALENSDSVLYISVENHEAMSRSKIFPGDVLLSIAGTIGRTSVVPPNSGEMNCNQAVAIIRPNERILPAYLMSWLDSPEAKRQIGLESVTATIANLSLGVISKLKIPVPSLETQRRLVRKLEDLDGVKDQAFLSLKAIDELFASLQDRAFKGEL